MSPLPSLSFCPLWDSLSLAPSAPHSLAASRKGKGRGKGRGRGRRGEARRGEEGGKGRLPVTCWLPPSGSCYTHNVLFKNNGIKSTCHALTKCQPGVPKKPPNIPESACTLYSVTSTHRTVKKESGRSTFSQVFTYKMQRTPVRSSDSVSAKPLLGFSAFLHVEL